LINGEPLKRPVASTHVSPIPRLCFRELYACSQCIKGSSNHDYQFR
jgi:hypothetical protein